MGLMMSNTRDKALAEKTSPNLTQVLSFAHQQSAKFPPHYDLDAAIREFKTLLDIKEDYERLRSQSGVPHQSPEIPASPLPMTSLPPASPVQQSGATNIDQSEQDGVQVVTDMTEVTSLTTPSTKEKADATDSEMKNLKETVAYQDMKIAELTSRLSAFASKQMSQGNPDITDLSDSNRPTKLGERFGELYDNEWSDAYEDLKPTMPSEKETLYILLRVVRYSYEFCQEFAEEQLRRLISNLDDALRHTTHTDRATKKSFRCVMTFTDEVRQKHFVGSLKFAKEFRRQFAKDVTPAVSRVFTELLVPRLFNKTMGDLPKSLQDYITGCIEIVWLMAVQDPPMAIRVPKEKSPINADMFKCYSRKGKVVDEPVWPALLLHEAGALISKGYVLPA